MINIQCHIIFASQNVYYSIKLDMIIGHGTISNKLLNLIAVENFQLSELSRIKFSDYTLTKLIKLHVSDEKIYK